MIKFKFIYLSLFFFAAVLSCNDDDDPIIINPEEVITTLTATLTPPGVGATIPLQSRDLDGDGPNAPIITVSNNLTANTTYLGTVKILNELVSPAEDVTIEIEEEGTTHQFFFNLSNRIASINYSDMDINNDPIGIEFTLTTNNVATGNLTITLIHEPIKSATGVSSGDITNAGGETDIEATFAITVQ